MCGICGKISLNSRVEEALIRKMCSVLVHRGPDDEGVYIGSGLRAQGSRVNVGLGHRRLSIIDLSPAGRQPMSNEDDSIWLVMNGEIYNFIELREVLEKKGHLFKSRTDTEVILHLYEEKGVECLEDLRGMFAFALWDDKKERLFLARDRLGQKPLFYSLKNSALVFASELNALLQDNGLSREIDIVAIDDFLNYGYIPAPFTIFKDINKLPPAHFLVWEKGDASIERYWHLDYSGKLVIKEEEYCERIRGMLRECTEMRLISDVPLGAFLSGGIDSSAVVAAMSGAMDRPVRTFSIGFEDRSFDETQYARVVSKYFGTEHKEFIVTPRAIDILRELVLHFGEPYADSSAIPVYYLSKLTRGYVTVALDGDAGDESFGGYERYLAGVIAESYRGPLSFVNRMTGRFIKGVPESTDKKDLAARIKRFLSVIEVSCDKRYAALMSIFREEERESIYSECMAEAIGQLKRGNVIVKYMKDTGLRDIVDSQLFTDLMTYMPGDLLPKVDITSMAHALEVRSPFLDHKFLEFSAKIPSNLKVKGLTTKYILKRSLRRTLPPEILKREKMGFGVPVGRWFRNELKDYAYDVLLCDKAAKRGYFNKDALKRLLDEHCAGKVNNGAKIWSLLFLEEWHRVFVDG